MAILLIVLTGAPLLVWCTRQLFAYSEAVRSARGQDPRLDVPEVFGGSLDQGFSDMLHRSDDPTIERKRRRAWAALGAWLAYMLFGLRLCVAAAEWFSR